MEVLCITGAPSALPTIQTFFQHAGMQAPEPAKHSEPIDIAQWHTLVAEALHTQPSQSAQAFGRLWEQLAADLFLANLNAPLWGWADERSVALLDFWASFEPRLCFVLVTQTPLEALAAAIEADEDFVIEETLRQWQAQHQALLRFHLRHPQRSLLVDAHDALRHPAKLIERCAAAWNLPLEPGEPFNTALPAPSEIARHLAAQILPRHPEITALANELAATLVPLAPEPESSSADDGPGALLAAYREQKQHHARREAELEERLAEQANVSLELEQEKVALAASLAAREKAFSQLETAHKTLTQELAQLRTAHDAQAKLAAERQQQLERAQAQLTEAEEENRLILEQLHLVQEELERYYLNTKDLEQRIHATEQAKVALEQEKAALEKAKAALEQEKAALAASLAAREKAFSQLETAHKTLTQELAQLRTAHDAQAKLAAERQQQLERAQAQLTEAEEENRLILEQLHLVQEELERYYLDHRDLKQKYTELEARWQRMLQRHPDTLDYEAVAFIPEGESAERLHWRFDAFNGGGRSFPRLEGQLFLDSGFAGLRFERTSSPLLRWPAAAREAEALELIPAGSGETLAVRLEALAELATSDWTLLRTLTPQLGKLLAQPAAIGLATDFPGQPWVEGLARLENVLSRFPAVLRYDRLQLLREQVNPDYEHLWLRLESLSLGEHRWPAFEFRFSCAHVRPGRFGSHPKLEFPAETGQAPFAGWYDESYDDFGPKLELRFALPEAMDLAVWQSLPEGDRAFLSALIARIPALLADLEAQGIVLKRPWADWQAMAHAVQRIAKLRAPAEPIAA